MAHTFFSHYYKDFEIKYIYLFLFKNVIISEIDSFDLDTIRFFRNLL